MSTGPCAPSVPLVDNAEMNDACLSVHGDLITTMEGEWEGFHSNLNIFKKQTGFLLAILPGVLTESSTCKASTFFLFVFFSTFLFFSLVSLNLGKMHPRCTLVYLQRHCCRCAHLCPSNLDSHPTAVLLIQLVVSSNFKEVMKAFQPFLQAK